MPLDFPSSPTVNQTYSFGGKTWVWNGSGWRLQYTTSSTDTITAAAFVPAGSTVPTNGVYLPSANTVGVATNGTGRLFVDSSGNVGVGTASPNNLLTVAGGNIAISRVSPDTSALTLRVSEGSLASPNAISLSSNLGVVSFNGYDGSAFRSAAQIYGVSDGAITSTSSPGRIQFQTTPSGSTTSLERLRITSDGKVGIGTSSPSTTLDVAGTISSSNVVALQLGSNAAIRDTTSGGSTVYFDVSTGSATHGAFAFRSSSAFTSRLYISDAGNVGIGNSSPGATLHISGGAARIDGAQQLRLYNITSTELAYISAEAVSNTNPALVFGTGNNEKARLDSSGRLLVGTSSDSGGALFQVNGDRIRVGTAKTPASATATGTAGEICWDTNYIYVCTATNTWKRAALSTW